MKFFTRKLKGLTLIELLVVIGIIMILAAMALVIVDPNKQKKRARDGVLKNAISSIGQSIDSFYSLKGYYPQDSNAPGQADELKPYVQGFTITTAASTVWFTNSAIITGAANNYIHYYVNDFNSDGISNLPCLQAVSNETPTAFISWAPGYAAKNITASCNTSAGYTQLTGIANP